MLLAKVSRRAAPRLLCWDCENRPLAYWYDGATTSEITAIGWKWNDQPDVHTLLLTATGRFHDGKRSLRKQDAYVRFCAELAAADVSYGHNIRRHDLPMLQAQLLRLEMPLLGPLMTTDTCRDIPKRAGISVSLANLASLYGLGVKDAMSQTEWEEANRLTAAGMGLARDRVVSDVLLQEQLRDRLDELGLLKRPRAWLP